jgi:Domain of unknown function (DUF4160)
VTIYTGSVAHSFADRAIPVLLLLSRRAAPPHVHVERDECVAKFWLDPAGFESSRGFTRAELRRIENIIEESESLLVAVRDEYFGD